MPGALSSLLRRYRVLPALLLAPAVLGISCRVLNTQEQKDRAAVILNARRPASLEAWRDVTIEGLVPSDYLAPRTAVVVPAAVTVVPSVNRKSGSASVVMDFREAKAIELGSAVPVSSDGYFLTAAHCVEREEGVTVIALNRSRVPAAARARVVWKSAGDWNSPDVALIHAPIRPASVMTSGSAPVGPNTEILTNGVGSRPFPNLTLGQSAGITTSIILFGAENGNPRWWRVHHTAPLAPGDSGGPVIDSEGRLAGINVGFEGRWKPWPWRRSLWTYHGWAEMVDPAWLKQQMERDRKAGSRVSRKVG